MKHDIEIEITVNTKDDKYSFVVPLDNIKKSLNTNPAKEIVKPKKPEKKSAELEVRMMAQDDVMVSDEQRFELELEIIDYVEGLIKEDVSLAKEFLNDNKNRFSPILKDMLSEMINTELGV